MLYRMADRVMSGHRERKDLVGQVIQRQRYERLVVILIRPSKYDDEAYVIRHFRGTLPSNTLSCLNSLTEDAVRQGALGGLDLRAAKRQTAFRRPAARLNVFSLQRLEARRDHVKEYWQCTWHTGLRFELWRLNPFALTWNFVRDCRDAVLFFAMRSERY